MYYEYWGMKKAPFDNVPDPTLYWNANNSLEDAISEILFAIEEGNDCLAVMVGEIGTGKTLGLRVILNELDPDKYRIAFITNPDLSSVQLMREIIGQLKNKKIDNRYKDQLMEEFNTILFDCANKGQKLVIFIDEANVMNTSQLHNLRLMTNLQEDQQNMIIFVLAGQKELGKHLESKAMENLYQRIGVYCRIKGLKGPEEVRQYLSHRIQNCGGSPEIFTQEAYNAIWLYSRKGVPRLINKITKLCLKAGETNQVKKIDAEIVHAVASMFEREESAPLRTHQQKKTISDKGADPFSEKPDSFSKEPDDSSFGIPRSLSKEPDDPPFKIPHSLSKEPDDSTSEVPRSFSKEHDDSPSDIKKSSPAPQAQSQKDSAIIDLIEGLPPQIRSQLQSMADKQLMDLAGKMAIEHVQQIGQKSAEDPVIIWHSIKGRIYSALKSIQEPERSYIASS